ncbi:MAG: SUMF1/EgtB/PvdO family nonheme iron enzyme [Gammaproteobacteria bacterium]|nr:SUMF1/EgtB/PvdO family nonheme iron enzyme [Gammaproteobacteria bacterium]
MKFVTGEGQIQGGRGYQEDRVSVVTRQLAGAEPFVLLLLADGMGGHAGGAVASQLIVESLVDTFSAAELPPSPVDVLKQATLRANAMLTERVVAEPSLAGMGCTLVAALCSARGVSWLSVGDSHLYLLRNRRVRKLNEDHSYGGYVDRMAAAGEEVAELPGVEKPRRNMLMSYLNGSEIPMVDFREMALELEAGDRLILASDGLDTLREEDLEWIAEEQTGVDGYIAALLAAVESVEKLNQDNTSVVVLEVAVAASGGAKVGESPEFSDVFDKRLGGALQELEATAEMEELVLGREAESFDLPDPVRQSPPAQSGEGDATAKFPRPESPARPDGQSRPAANQDGVSDFEVIRDPVRVGLWLPAMVFALVVAGSVWWFWPQVERGGDQALATVRTLSLSDERAPILVPSAVEAAARSRAESAVSQGPPPALTARRFQDPLRGGGRGPVMIEIHPNSYLMGGDASSFFFEERPRHEVQLSTFSVSQDEVTFDLYDRYVAATGARRPADVGWGRGSRPVINVSWAEAVEFTRWLSTATGARYRLPTEAEWEYVAGDLERSLYSWGAKIGVGNANCWGCGSQWDGKRTAPVGSFAPNPFGLHDTAGNVLEWVQDCFHKGYQGAPVDGSAWEEPGCARRVVRGGSFSNPPDSLRVTKRTSMDPTSRRDNIGFRLVREH